MADAYTHMVAQRMVWLIFEWGKNLTEHLFHLGLKDEYFDRRIRRKSIIGDKRSKGFKKQTLFQELYVVWPQSWEREEEDQRDEFENFNLKI